jgi:RES domain-containing protein
MYSPLEAGVNVILFKESNPSNFGTPLLDLVQEDWDVFGDRLIQTDRAYDLLEDIVNSDWDDDDGESPLDAHELYTRNESLFHDSLSEKWAEFREQVIKDPTLKPDFHELFGEDLARAETELKQGAVLYHARPGFAVDENDRPVAYAGTEIGAPQTEKTLPSRASPQGKRVLYCADELKTAIAEIRPQRGLLVSVAKMRITKDLRILDLCARLVTVNPFKEESLKYELELREVLADFSDDLAKPLRRTDNPVLDYLASQKIAALVEEAGYDGIMYRSAMAPSGRNVVIFDPYAAEPIESELVEITRITIQHQRFMPEE